MFDLDDTICAIASAPGGAVRGIVRLSGPQAFALLSKLMAGAKLEWSHRTPYCRWLMLALGPPLGDVPCTVYVWPTQRSYTRQPSAELHLPGSPPILEAALQALCAAGARLARPGEFTLRALLAGRLDLTQAEAVLGVIDAQTQAELNTALGQLAGGLARPLAALRERLLDLLAHLEAGLDFADEEIEFISQPELDQQLASLGSEISAIEKQMHARGQTGAAPRIVLAGLPNTGKSSLLNALSHYAAALVSDVAGTTRDFITRQLVQAGREWLIVDTAGLAVQPTTNAVDAAAQQQTAEQLEQADLVLWCLDATRAVTEWEQERLQSLPPDRLLVVWTKCDLPVANERTSLPGAAETSSHSGFGLADLRAEISARLDHQISEAGIVASTADRCRESLRQAAQAISRARTTLLECDAEELVASEIRVALDELGRVVGAVFTDDILDRVFSRFCIGK